MNVEGPQGKFGRTHAQGARDYRAYTTFDGEEWALLEEAKRRSQRQRFSNAQLLRLAALKWARDVLEQEGE